MKNDLWISVFIMMGLVVVFVFAEISTGFDKDNNQYAVVFPTNLSDAENMELVHKAGGRMIRDGFLSNIKLVYATDHKFQSAIYKNGALFVFKPFIKGGCITMDQTRFQIAHK